VNCFLVDSIESIKVAGLDSDLIKIYLFLDYLSLCWSRLQIYSFLT
jgi:hypothetical protein